jgi:hypothetical protein
VPAIPGDNVVTAWGSYTKIGTARVKVTMCAKQTGTAFSVGAVALVYSASGTSKNIGATILTGPGNTSCVMNTFILYTAHLKVHAFIGGRTGPDHLLTGRRGSRVTCQPPSATPPRARGARSAAADLAPSRRAARRRRVTGA